MAKIQGKNAATRYAKCNCFMIGVFSQLTLTFTGVRSNLESIHLVAWHALSRGQGRVMGDASLNRSNRRVQECRT